MNLLSLHLICFHYSPEFTICEYESIQLIVSCGKSYSVPDMIPSKNENPTFADFLFLFPTINPKNLKVFWGSGSLHLSQKLFSSNGVHVLFSDLLPKSIRVR